MSPQRWDRMERLYRSALATPPERRAHFLAEACTDDEERGELESLLHERESSGSDVGPEAWEVLAEAAHSLAPGTRFGAYEILEPAGAGGMGEVYRARDTRLNRLVAIKILRDGWGPDDKRKARFERKAKTLAGLQHAHICGLYDIGQQDGLDFLVMEHLEGQTLAERLTKGAMSASEALRVAVEIASALDQAHRRGITHRDLKPGNIMLTSSGAKLLDFGLAKAQASPFSEESTQSGPLTREGSIVGTWAYMSPEQLEGKEADARSDVFAFGAVVYEMATGRRAFQGNSQVSVMAAIMSEDPPALAGILATPRTREGAALERVVRTCLKKDPEQRWQSAGELLHVLQWMAAEPPENGASRRRGWAPWAVAGLSVAVLILAAAISMWIHAGPEQTDSARLVLTVSETPTGGIGNFCLSPDGRNLAVVADGSLWIRPLGSLPARRLAPVEGSNFLTFPFWSPDGQFIAFNAAGKLYKIAVSGGPAQQLSDRVLAGHGTWGSRGFLLVGGRGGLFRIPASGGGGTPVTQTDQADGELGHREPQFLPDGKHFLYLTVNRNPAKSAVYVQEMDSSRRTLVLHTQWKATFSPPGSLVFVKDGTLLAQNIDLQSFQLRGDPVLLADELLLGAIGHPGPADYSVSGNVLAYRSSHSVRNQELVWYGRSGNRIQAAGEPGWYTFVKISPDDQHVSVERRDGRNPYPDIWLQDIASGIFTRRTFDASTVDQAEPTWSPDAKRIVVRVNTGAGWEVREIVASSGATRVLYSDTRNILLGDWSRDGRFLVCKSESLRESTVYLLPLTGEVKPQVLFKTPFQVDQFHFSPDGRWLAYNSNESGRHEIYIVSLPSLSEKRQVSVGGGVQPLWRKDGKELFYLSLDGKLTAVDVKLSPVLFTGIPKTLFQTSAGLFWGGDYYAATGDGKKFLIIEAAKKPSEVNVVLNWNTGLRP